MAKSEVYAGISSDAVQAKTSKAWSEWFAVLDKAGAAEWPHKEIATYLHEQGCGDWWSQMVTVGYEQARGLRVKHQTAAGFVANVSKTMTVPLAALYAAWADARARRKWLPDATTLTIRKATENRSLRVTWHDETNVDVMFCAKGSAKSQVAVEHSKLSDSEDVTRIKSYWSAALTKLQTLLEGATQVKKPATAVVRSASSASARTKTRKK